MFQMTPGDSDQVIQDGVLVLLLEPLTKACGFEAKTAKLLTPEYSNT